MFRIRAWRLAVALCLAVSLGAAPAAAGAGRRPAPGKVAGSLLSSSATLEASLGRLAAEADRVFLGLCLAVESAPREEPGAAPGRLATFRVERTLKGPGEDLFTLRFRSRGHPGDPGSKTAPAARSEQELLHYAPPEPEEKPAARQARLARLRHLPRARGGSSGHGPAPPTFHRDERVLLFLPPLEDGEILNPSTPGFAKLLVVEIEEGSGLALVPVAGPAWLTAPPAALGPSARPLESLLEELERRLDGGAREIRPAGGRTP